MLPYRVSPEEPPNPKAINSGVFTKGADDIEYYGRLENVYGLTFSMTNVELNLVVFKCHWFEPQDG
jgi:ribosomal protein L30E